MNRTFARFACAACLALPVAAAASGAPHPAPPLRARAASARSAPATPAAHAPASERTLDDIHIEGEIPVPQVLFITAREQRRFLEFRHGRYLRSSWQLGEATPLPDFIVLTHAPIPAGKEIAR